ncbi:MAG: hypothetical protein WC465_01390 [Patescibacteria group bacterium]
MHLNRKKFIFIIILVVVIGLLIGLGFFIKDKQSTVSNQPDITKVYTLDDFPQVSKDPESAFGDLVTRLNKDYDYLRQNIDFDKYDIWVDIGNTKLGLKDYAGAVEAWQYAIVLNPKRPLAYSNLGNYYKVFGNDYEKSVYYYDKTIQIDNIGYFFDYQSYAELYTAGYLPANPGKVEAIMLEGVAKAGNVEQRQFYQYLYTFFADSDPEKSAMYKEKLLAIDPSFK